MYRVVVQGWSKEDALNEMTGGFGDSTHFKDGIRYMMQADVDKLRTALANGDCSTSHVLMKVRFRSRQPRRRKPAGIACRGGFAGSSPVFVSFSSASVREELHRLTLSGALSAGG
jgi:hypothetical protein